MIFFDAIPAIEENESNQVDILLQFNLVFLSDEVKALLDQELGLDWKKRFSKLNYGGKIEINQSFAISIQELKLNFTFAIIKLYYDS